MLPQVPPAAKRYESQSWQGLLKRLRQMQLSSVTVDGNIDWSIGRHRDSDRALHNKTLAASLHLHGDLGPNDTHAMAVESTGWRNDFMYSALLDQPVRVFAAKPFDKNFRACAAISNSQSSCGVLNSSLERASEMVHAGAYSTQYEQFGISRMNFDESIGILEQILQNYKHL